MFGPLFAEKGTWFQLLAAAKNDLGTWYPMLVTAGHDLGTWYLLLAKVWVVKTRNDFMIHELDLYFPYFVLMYGAIMTVMTQLPALKEKANENMNAELVQWFYGHRALGLICLGVGSLWSLQRLVL